MPGRTGRTLQRTPVRIADIMAEIQTMHLPDMSPEYYWFTSLLTFWPQLAVGLLLRRKKKLPVTDHGDP
jgi:hypothetical protein